MALVTFDELEAANPAIKSLGYNPAARSVATTEEEFAATRAQAAAVAERSVIGAAFQNENLIGSFFSSKSVPTRNTVDPNFDVFDYIKQNGLEGQEDYFLEAMNKDKADALLSDLQRKQQNDETLAAAGWAGTIASIGASVVDPTIIIPGAGVVRGAKGGFSVAKTALLGGVAAGGATALQEAGLQGTQVGRSAEESFINIGASVILGGMIGGGMAGLLAKGERKAAEDAVGRLVDMSDPTRAPGAETQGINAQFNEAAEPDIFEVRPREDFEVDGKLATGAVEATRFLSPVLRATQYSANAARQHVSSLFENTIYRTMHSKGESVGASPETMVNVSRAKEAIWAKEGEANYKAMRKAGVRMSRDDYYKQVGLAIRNGDEHPDPYIASAAKAMRREILDPLKDEALRTQRSGGDFLLDEEDLGLKGGDASYAPVMYLPHVLNGKQAQWEAEVGPIIEARMQKAWDEQSTALSARMDSYDTQIADLQTAGIERVAKIGEVEKLGDQLDAEFKDVQDLADDLADATATARAAGNDYQAKDAALAAAKAAREKGGERLQDYLKRRADLRRRKRNLTRDNADAQAIKRSKIEDRIEAVREADASAVRTFTRQIKNVINRIDKNLPGRAQELLDGAMVEVERLQKLLGASEKRVAKLSEAPGEQPAGLAAYVAGERAAAEAATKAARDLVDQMQDIAARGVTDDDYDGLRAALDLKPVNPREARLAAAEKVKGARETKLADAGADVAERQKALEQAQQAARDLAEKLDALNRGVSDRSMRRGEFLQRAKDRAAKLSPEEVKKQNAAKLAELGRFKALAKQRHAKTWEGLTGGAPGAKGGPTPQFREAARQAALDTYNKVTGRAARDAELPPGITRFSVGPLKDRTLNLPTEVHLRNGWIETDARVIAARHTRAMAAEIELTRRFGRADMRDQIAEVTQDYTDLRSAVGTAGSVSEINTIIGKNKYSEKMDLAEAQAKAQSWLSAQEDTAVKDLQSGRDLLRGDFNAQQNQNWASVSRSVRAFNFITRMGGVALSSVPEIVRPAMVHGLKGYFPALGRALATSVGKGGAATKMLAREAELMGLATQRVLNSVNVAMSDLGDPYIGKVTAFERLLEKGTRIGSRWSGIDMLTDFQQNLSSIMSQHRIIAGVMGQAGKDGSFIRSSAENTRLMAMLGIDDAKAARIRDMLTTHSEEIDGIRVPNTEAWDDEGAVRAYRAAVNLDVNSIISRKGLGDAPIFANTPGGALLLQFSGYGMGAHSRVMIRGLQEDRGRFISGLAAMSILGGMAAWVSSYRTVDPESGAKMRERWSENYMSLLGEGLDRSGIFPLLFDVSNRVDRMSGSLGGEYRMNPIKSTLTALGGGNFTGNETSRASDASGVFSGIGGPTVGLIESALSAGRVAAEAVQGEKAPKQDVARALATIPYSSYVGVRMVTQWLHEAMTQ